MKPKPARRSNLWRPLLLTALTAQLAPMAARAQSLDAAREFTATLYRAYQKDGGPGYLGRKARTTFAPQLLALIRRDQATTPSGDVGVLDGDPICDCQDAGGLKVDGIKVAPMAPGRAKAVATLGFPSETRSVTLVLIALRGRWWVADVRTHETPSLVKLMERGLPATSGGPSSGR